MSVFYYWRDYAANTDRGPTFKLNRSNQLLATIKPGESLWAIAHAGGGRYMLAAEMVVRRSGRNAADDPERHYGEFFVEADPARSRYFDPDAQESVEPIIRRLSIRANAEHLGQSFQGASGVRPLTPEDDGVLRGYASGLSLDPRLSVEFVAAATTPASMADDIGVALSKLPPEKRERVAEAFVRDHRLVAELKEMYGNRCQICDTVPFGGVLGDISEAHHITWLSRGGTDALENLVLLCPNRHSAVHAVDPDFDWKALTFRFGDRIIPVRRNEHLQKMG
jgi:5-methylcytosine-specific restriction enzyme A